MTKHGVDNSLNDIHGLFLVLIYSLQYKKYFKRFSRLNTEKKFFLNPKELKDM